MREENVNAENNTEEKAANKRKNNENALVTRESIGAVGALFTALAFLILVTRSAIFGEIGLAVDSFLLGLFGYGAYFFAPFFFLISVSAFIGKRFFKKKIAVTFAVVSLLLILLIVHGALTASWESNDYFSACFNAAEGGVKTCTPAGWLGGLVVGSLFSLAGKVGAFVLLSITLLCFVALTIKAFFGKSLIGSAVSKIKSKVSKKDESEQVSANRPGYENVAQEDGNANWDNRYGYANRPNLPNDENYRANEYKNYGYSSQNAYAANTSGANFGQGNGGMYPNYEKRNEYGFPQENFPQRPGVTLSKNIAERRNDFAANSGGGTVKDGASYGYGEYNGNPTDSFSPFGSSYYGNGTSEAARVTDGANATPSVQTGRDLIYGADPVESFRNNLIFDPDSKFNRRKSAANEPIGTPVSRSSADVSAMDNVRVTSPQSGFGKSYTNSYADAVNGDFSQGRVVSGTADRTTIGDSRFLTNGESSDYLRTKQNDMRQSNVAYTRETSDFSVRETTRETEKFHETRNYAEPFERTNEEDSLQADSVSDFRENELRVENDLRNDRGVRGEDYTAIFDDEEDFTSGNESVRGIGDDLSDFRNDRRGGNESDFRGGFRDDPLDDFRRESRGVSSEKLSADSRVDFVDFEGERTKPDLNSPTTGKPSTPVAPSFQPSVRSVPSQPVTPPTPKPRVIRPYRSAPLDYFDCSETRPDQNAVEIEENKETILETLSAFKVPDASIASVTCGPTVTRYNVAVPRNISPKKVVALDQPIAMNLHSKNGVNIAPNFEGGTISVEVPNKNRQIVTLGSMLVADEYINSKPNALVFAMGKTVDNVKTYGDIRKLTHVLVAGTSGSGKTAFLHSVIISLIMKYSPADLRLILIDPKKTEFVVYEGLPHLVINEVLSDTNKVIQSLNWAIAEMERRYDLFNKKSRAGTYVINIDEYNANLVEGEEKLPKIVIIADEVAAMMQDAKKDMEDRIQNLTQKSRATGIHVVLATQRPSTDVITGVIKSNLKTRIALSVAQEIDSRVILDESGAQNLLGHGDLLYSTEGTKTPIRMQAPFISSEKAQEVIRYIKENNDCYFNEEAAAFIDKPKGQSVGFGAETSDDGTVDYVYIDALRNVILSGSASISLVQRKCSVGYNKAGKIIEWMEDQGYISAFDGAKARKVLITPEQFEEKYGPL